LLEFLFAVVELVLLLDRGGFFSECYEYLVYQFRVNVFEYYLGLVNRAIEYFEFFDFERIEFIIFRKLVKELISDEVG
jgi:hypothetical protein